MLRNLLNERQIIREMRERYLGETQVNPQALPAMLFAGVLLEGGVIGYDTNTVTGGAGASFLGIGGRTEYRQDTVTVYRSEEHTSELQSLMRISYAVFCLKKKKHT